MRLRIGREALADAVTWAARALPSRPVIPILAGLLLEADKGDLTLSCFDYEVSARVSADAAVAEQGRVLVSGRLLAEIARSLPDRPVDLAVEGDNVMLSCGTARFTLLALPVDDFPALPELPPVIGTVDSAEFARAVTQVAVAAGRDDTLPMLTGILVEIDGAAMTLVATDRYRMSMRELDWRPARPGIRASVLVPARTLTDAAKSMTSDADVVISLAIADRTGPGGVGGAGTAADGLIGFDGGRRRLTMRLLGTEFIAYKSRFPREFGYQAALAAGPFSEAIRRVALVADRDSRLLLTFGSDEVVIETGSSDGSQAVEIMGAKLEGGDGFAVAFNPHYLLDGIGAAAADAHTRDAAPGSRSGRAGPGEPASAGGGESSEYAESGESAGRPGPGEPAAGDRGGSGDPQAEVFLQFTSPDKPAVITGAPGFRYLLAPMRI